MLHLQITVGVLVDHERVDDAYRVGCAEPLQLGDDLTVEVGVTEPQHDELHWPDCHVLTSFTLVRLLLPAVFQAGRRSARHS